MLRRYAVGLLFVLTLAGCGGGAEETVGGGPSPGADFAPASVPAFIELNTDVDGDQWKRADDLLDKFPGRQTLLDAIVRELEQEGVNWNDDIKPALGDAAYIVWLDFENGGENLVGYAKPKDKAKFLDLLESGDDPAVQREIEGWTVFADTDALLDRFEQAREGGSLADEDLFTEAMDGLTKDSLARAYVAGPAIADALSEASQTVQIPAFEDFESAAAALTVEEDGVRVAAIAKGESLASDAVTYTPELLDRVPGDAFAILSFKGGEEQFRKLGDNPAFQQQLGELERMLGVSFNELASLFSGEVALYVRPGSPIPEVTLLLAAENEQDALRTIDRLIARVAPLADGRTGSDEIDGVQTRYLEIQGIRISYASVDDLVVVTSGRSAIRDLRSDGDKLSDDEAFERAKEASGLEDETSGFLYINLAELVPLIQGFAGLAGEGLPPEVSQNLAPLDSLVVHGTADAETVEFEIFLGVR